MIELFIFFTVPIWLPILAIYFSSWNKRDPRYQKFVHQYGEDKLRDMVRGKYD